MTGTTQPGTGAEAGEAARSPVVVGVDGSAQSLDAVDTAVHEARLRGRALRVVHAFLWPYLRVPLEPSPYGPPEGGLLNEAEQIVAQAVDRARAQAPRVDVYGDVVTGAPTTVLVAESASADLVVVGSRGLGGFTGLLVGSVAVQLAAHAACPVVVVRAAGRPHGDVLLGVDGSAANAPAVTFAFEEAALRGVGLTALSVWTYPVPAGRADTLPLVYDADQVSADEEQRQAAALTAGQEKYPQVPVHSRVVQGRTRATLIEASRDAGLVVVGSRGRGGFSGLLLGSVSQAVLHHAACPVAVVPHRLPAL